MPRLNTEIFKRVLADFAQHFGFGEHKRAIIVVDQAGWHISKNLQLPSGIHLSLLPSHSPELQPSERLWSLTDEAIVNKSFEDIDELEEVIFRRCQALLPQKDLLSRFTLYHWWPREEDYSVVV